MKKLILVLALTTGLFANQERQDKLNWSFAFPGVGQILDRQYLKGSLIFIGFYGSVVTAIVTSINGNAYTEQNGTITQSSSNGTLVVVSMLCAMSSFAIYAYNIYDVSVSVKSDPQGVGRVEVTKKF